MRHTVVLTAAFPSIAREILAPLADLVEQPSEPERTEDELIAILDEADAAMTLLSDPLTRRVLSANPHLRMVANYAVGYNNIDIEAARELGIIVTNTPGVLTDATADLTIALILAVIRRIVEGVDEVRRTGRCEWEPMKLHGVSLQGKRLGIIGPGRIGCAVASRASAFGMEIAFASRSGSAIPGGRRMALQELLETSDIVSLHVPLSGETKHLIGREALGLMKSGAYLVNTSRGALVDESALCDSLESGAIAGAALDVYEREPAIDPRLLAMPNVVCVPHIGSATAEARGAMASIAATEIARHLTGREPLHRIC